MKQLIICATATLLALSACQHNSQNGNDKEASDTTAVVSTNSHVSDSTLYGIADEFGMSTFTIVTTKGDTLNLTRTDRLGNDGKIYGSLRDNDQYALTTCDNQKAISVVINLTQLNKHIKDYTICNGKLIINKDTVEIEKLTDTVFKYK